MARTPPKMAPIKGKCCTGALIYKTQQKTFSFFLFLNVECFIIYVRGFLLTQWPWQ